MQQINPSLAKIWISPTTVQYGYPIGTRIANLTAAKERLLHFLEQGFLTSQLPVLSRLANCDSSELADVMQAVQPLLADWTAGLNQLGAAQLELLQPEIHRLLRLGRVPAPILLSRDQTPVFISDFGRFGSLLLDLLIDLGFSQFITCDSSLRQPAVGDADSVGASRLRSMKSALPQHCQLQLHSLLHKSTMQRIGLAILIEFEVCNPVELQSWQSFDVPLVRVRFAESGSFILAVVNSEPDLLESGVGESPSPEDALQSHELAVAEAQLAKSPRRFESVSDVIGAAALVVQEVIRLVELVPKPREK